MSAQSAIDDRDGTDETATHRLTKDEAFHLLQNARRRAVLRYIIEQDGDSYVMRDVAEAVAAWEHDTTVRLLNSTQRQRVYIALYQSHLPKLADAGVIDYDQSRGDISPRPAIELLEPFLEEGLDADASLTPDAGDSRPSLAGVVALLAK